MLSVNVFWLIYKYYLLCNGSTKHKIKQKNNQQPTKKKKKILAYRRNSILSEIHDLLNTAYQVTVIIMWKICIVENCKMTPVVPQYHCHMALKSTFTMMVAFEHVTCLGQWVFNRVIQIKAYESTWQFNLLFFAPLTLS